MPIQSEVNAPTIVRLLDLLGIDCRDAIKGRVKVVRHATWGGQLQRSYRENGLEWLEKYQSCQKDPVFHDVDYVIAFVGADSTRADFIGVYRVDDQREAKEAEIREFAGSAAELDDRYLYRLIRDQRFDVFKERIEIEWGGATVKWHQRLPRNDKSIASMTTLAGEKFEPQTFDEVFREIEVALRKDSSDEEAESYCEGKVYYRQHLMRERSVALVKKVKNNFKRDHNGKLFCEICGFDFSERYIGRGDGFIECHHNKPVSEMLPGEKTKVVDIVLLCSNCHRMMHRHKPWISKDQLKEMYRPEGQK